MKLKFRCRICGKTGSVACSKLLGGCPGRKEERNNKRMDRGVNGDQILILNT